MDTTSSRCGPTTTIWHEAGPDPDRPGVPEAACVEYAHVARAVEPQASNAKILAHASSRARWSNGGVPGQKKACPAPG